MTDVFTEITALLDTEDANVQAAIDAENQRHENVLATLTKRQQDLAQVRTTLDQLEEQAAEPVPEPAETEAPAATAGAGDAAAVTPDGSEAAAVVSPDPEAAAAVPETIEVVSASTGAVAVVPAADLAVATDPSVPDADLTPPQQALRNSDYK